MSQPLPSKVSLIKHHCVDKSLSWRARVCVCVCLGAAHGASNTAPNLVNRTMLKFLSGRTWPEDKARKPVKTDFAAALKRLQLITHDTLASPESRPADRPLSFSTKTKEEAEQFNAMVESVSKAAPMEPSIPWGLGGAHTENGERVGDTNQG